MLGSAPIRLYEWRGLPELTSGFFVDRGTVLGLVVGSPEPALKAVLSDASIVDPSVDKDHHVLRRVILLACGLERCLLSLCS